MPVSGMPLALGNALDALFDANKLSSWKINGGNAFTTVTLRFKMEDIPVNTSQSVTYRSKPPSAVSRDTERKVKWQAEKNIYSRHQGGNLLSNNKTGVSSKLKTVSFIPESKSAESRSTAKPSQPVASTSEVTSSPCTNGQDSSTQKRQLRSSVTAVPTEPNHNKHLEEVLPGHYPCDICGKNISTLPKTECWTCTECNDFAFCLECFNQGKHHEHLQHIHKFVVPPVDISCYCRSCGYTFPTNRNILIECTICSDNYILCLNCQKQGMHQKHSYFHERKTRKEYYQL